MTQRNNTWLNAALAAVFGILLLVGSFCDLPLIQAVYHKNDPVSLAFTVIGEYLFFGAFVFLEGGLLRQLLAAEHGKLWKTGVIVACGYTGLSTSVLGAAGLLSDSCCGQLFEGDFTFWQSGIAGAVCFYPLFFLGFAVSVRQYDRMRAKRLIYLLILMTVIFFSLLFIKDLTGRPRYHVTLAGYDGIGFVPWYQFRGSSAAERALYGLHTDDFCSFFSGHALHAVLNVIILPAFADVIPGLRGKERLLGIIGAVLIVPICMSRMVLGAHYLSDLAVGGLVGTALLPLYEKLTAEK